MVARMELRDLSDEALREHLRTKIADRRWTASEVIEVERRGLAVLDPDPELASAFRERYEGLLAPAREAFKKFDLGMKGVSDGNLDLGFDFSAFPDAAEGRHLESMGALGAIAVHTGKIEANTRRSWFEWAQFVFVFLGVLLTVVAFL